MTAADRRRYRKVFTRLWRNADFRAMSAECQVLTFYILTGPQTNRIGLFVLSLGEASEDLGTTADVLKARLETVIAAFGWEFDARARVVWIPSWWSYNDPKENVKAFQGALTDVNEVPRCALISKFCKNLQNIPEALRGLITPIREAIGDRTPIRRVSHRRSIAHGIPARSQEQEQEQEQEKEQEQETAPPSGRSLIELWNETVKELPKAQALTGDRLKRASARVLEQPDMAKWRAVFERMDASDFLTGRVPSKDHPGWRADIDFALKPDVSAKVLEGKYDNRRALALTGTEGRGRTGVTPGKFAGLEEHD